MTKPHTFDGDALATTNDYVDVPITTIGGTPRSEFLTTTSSGPISVNWHNTGADTINTRVLGGNNVDMDDDDKRVVSAIATIAADASRHIEIPIAYFQFYWFQHESTVDDTPGESTFYGRHSRV